MRRSDASAWGKLESAKLHLECGGWEKAKTGIDEKRRRRTVVLAERRFYFLGSRYNRFEPNDDIVDSQAGRLERKRCIERDGRSC